MDALLPGIVGAVIGLAIMRRGARKQLRINEAVLQRDLNLLALLPEDSEHRIGILQRVDRALDIDAGRPDDGSVRPVIIQYAVCGVLTIAGCVYVLVDLLRTADERSDLIIGGFVIGLTGAIAAFSLASVLELSLLRRRARSGG